MWQQPQAAAERQAGPSSPPPPPPPPLVARTRVQVVVSAGEGRRGSEVELSVDLHTLLLPHWQVVPVGSFTVGGERASHPSRPSSVLMHTQARSHGPTGV